MKDSTYYTRLRIKNALLRLQPAHRAMFWRMYGKDKGIPEDRVADLMDVEKLPRALEQVDATLKKLGIEPWPVWDCMGNADKKPFLDLAVDLLAGCFICTRDWSAWDVGTMTADDFQVASDDDELLYDVAEKLFEFKMGKN